MNREKIYTFVERVNLKKIDNFSSVRDLRNIFSAIHNEPKNIKKRYIDTSSPEIENALSIPGASSLLEAAGFVAGKDEYTLDENVSCEVIENFLDAIHKYGFTKPELYTVKVDDQVFEISTRYKIHAVVGSGAYGVVCSGHDLQTDKPVAIKKILHTFEHGKDYQKRILREIKIMKHFKDLDNIISIIDFIPPQDFDSFKDIYIVMHLMDGDLKKIRDSPQELTDENCQYFLYHILLGVQKIHSANVLHRDLKPSNILIDKEMDVRICDFGLSRGIDVEDPSQSTLYVATRWYRAPELLLQYPKSSKAIDLWSVGCIFSELIQKEKRRPLFPGQNYLKQIDLIIDQLGTPTESELKGSPKALAYVKNLPLKLKKDWKKRFPHANPDAIDLLERLLCFDPENRITADEALQHKYLENIFDKDDLVQVPEFTYSFDDNIDLSKDKDAIKRMIYDEIMEFNAQENGIYGDGILLDTVVEIKKKIN